MDSVTQDGILFFVFSVGRHHFPFNEYRKADEYHYTDEAEELVKDFRLF
jgi:hypothetical protein